MKKILILLIFLIPIVSAQDISISLSKENYNQYETLQAEIFVNLSLVDKLTASNFALIDYNNKTIPVSIFLEEISDRHYFIYFDIPKLNNATYRFLVKDVKYIDEILKKSSVSKEFYLSNLSSISISPAVFNRLNSTILKIRNHGDHINITLTSDDLNLSKSISLKDDFSLDIKIPNNLNNFNLRIDYGGLYYLIPVIPYQERINEFKKDEEVKPLLLPPKNAIVFLNSTSGYYFNDKIFLTEDSSPEGPFYIKNTWIFPIKNITFAIKGDLKEIARLNTVLIPVLQPDETFRQYIWLNENKNPQKLNYFGNIEIESEDGLFYILPLNVIFVEEIASDGGISNKSDLITNRSFGSKPNQTSLDKKINAGKNKNLILPFLLLILVILAVFVYILLRKNKRKRSFDEFLEEIK